MQFNLRLIVLFKILFDINICITQSAFNLSTWQSVFYFWTSFSWVGYRKCNSILSSILGMELRLRTMLHYFRFHQSKWLKQFADIWNSQPSYILQTPPRVSISIIVPMFQSITILKLLVEVIAQLHWEWEEANFCQKISQSDLRKSISSSLSAVHSCLWSSNCFLSDQFIRKQQKEYQ